ASLRLIPAPPVLLYCKGTLPQFNGRLSVAVVGTRKMSDYGKRMAFEISRDLARAGAIVVSGLALGVDGVANAAAINGGGETVAVLGSGIDIIYPPAHAKLAEFVVRHGALVTEFPPGTRPEGRNFPIRNRIISGLASATAVIEADLISGALITARRALQQGRPLYALPGRVDDKGSEGTCILLKNGAKLLVAADDILTDFEKVYADKINIFRLLQHSPVVIDAVLRSMRVSSKKERRPSPEDAPPPPPPAKSEPVDEVDPARKAEVERTLERLGELPRRIYGLIPASGQVSCDELAEAGIGIGDVMAATATMEIEGIIEMLPGGLIQRK
ncbi:MAG: DNA-processing protein DprA, partial [Clostridia bacterium]|nr:DNA-processing protein DprA [Clostridia bacterium]